MLRACEAAIKTIKRLSKKIERFPHDSIRIARGSAPEFTGALRRSVPGFYAEIAAELE